MQMASQVSQPPPSAWSSSQLPVLKLFLYRRSSFHCACPFLSSPPPLIACATCPAWNDLSSLLLYLNLTFHWSRHTSRKPFLASAGRVHVGAPSSEPLLHFLFIPQNSVIFQSAAFISMICLLNSAVNHDRYGARVLELHQPWFKF